MRKSRSLAKYIGFFWVIWTEDEGDTPIEIYKSYHTYEVLWLGDELPTRLKDLLVDIAEGRCKIYRIDKPNAKEKAEKS